MAPIRKKPLRSPVKDPAKRRRTRSSSSSAEPKGPPTDRNSAEPDHSQLQQEAIQSPAPPQPPTHEEIFGSDSDEEYDFEEGQSHEKTELGEAEWPENSPEEAARKAKGFC